MPKRKREDSDGDIDGAVKGAGVKQRRVAHKLQQGTKRVAHAFKLAKGFERQKLSRRRKTATSQQKDGDVARIDAEIIALKALDHAAAAQTLVHKTLLKIKAVSAHPDLPDAVRNPPGKVTDAPTLNVVARLCKSNQAKEALAPVLADVQNALGVDGGLAAKGEKKRRTRAKDYERDTATKASGSSAEPALVLEKGPKQKQARVRSEADGDIDDLAEYNERIAMSDDGEEPSDDGAGSDRSIGEIERQLESEGVKRNGPGPETNGYDHEADLSISESESNAASPSPEPQKATSGNKSSFLPTLTMGGYISGSGSEIDEVDTSPKRNRRGQRARQQLWEKKYGMKAKHLQSAKESRQAGWDAKRGATDGSEWRSGRERIRGGPKDKPATDGDAWDESQRSMQRHSGERKKRERDDGGAIHPSWAAAKKAKEKKEVPVAFQGKKTTFD